MLAISIASAPAKPVQAAILDLEADFEILFQIRFLNEGQQVLISGLESPDPVPIFVSTDGGSFHLASAVLSGSAVATQLLYTGISLLSSASFPAVNLSGTLEPGGGGNGGFGGAFGFDGGWRNGILAGLVNITIPGSVLGAGGVAQVGAAAIVVTVTGHVWSTGTVAVTGLSVATSSGGFENTALLSGYDDRTVGHAGALRLVTPIRVLSNAAFPFSAFGITTLSFELPVEAVPEAGTLLFMAAVLVIIGVDRARRR